MVWLGVCMHFFRGLGIGVMLERSCAWMVEAFASRVIEVGRI